MAGVEHGRLHGQLLWRCWPALFVMGMSFVAFGTVPLTLLHSLEANPEFIAGNGFFALREGGVRQLGELVPSGYGAAAFYVVFKLYEKVLVERLGGTPPGEPES